MEMTLREHYRIAEFIGVRMALYRHICKNYALRAVAQSDDDCREDYLVRYKAYMLMFDALRQLCDEYDFDCVISCDD